MNVRKMTNLNLEGKARVAKRRPLNGRKRVVPSARPRPPAFSLPLTVLLSVGTVLF